MNFFRLLKMKHHNHSYKKPCSHLMKVPNSQKRTGNPTGWAGGSSMMNTTKQCRFTSQLKNPKQMICWVTLVAESRKCNLVWAVFLWLSIYIYLTYSEKFSGLCSSWKSSSGYFDGNTWKSLETYIFVQVSYFFVFLLRCSVSIKILHLMIK